MVNQKSIRYSIRKGISHGQGSLANQQGVALLTILLLVVAITVLAGSMLASQKVSMRQTQLIFEQDGLNQQLAAGQQLAVEMIKMDSQLNDYDGFEDIWAKPIPPYAHQQYMLMLEVNDASSRFNINNLYHDNAVDEMAVASFKQLLRLLELDEQLATAILDWQDPDNTVHLDNANEADVYTELNKTNGTSNTIANQPLISVEQLLDIPQIDAKTLARLRPYIVTVPVYTPININTANPLLVFAALNAAQELASEQAKKKPNNANTNNANKGSTNKQPGQNQAAHNQAPVPLNLKQLETQLGQLVSEPLEKPEQIWQMAELASFNEATKKLLKPLLSVNSGAFEVLASVSDNKNRTKYQTFTIIKAKPQTTDAKQSLTQSKKLDTATQVVAVNQRVWTFPPPFATAKQP